MPFHGKRIKLTNSIVNIICLAIILAFSRGVMDMIDIPPGLAKGAILGLTILAFLLSCFCLKINGLSFFMEFSLVFILYTNVVAFSSIINNSVLKETLTFYHATLIAFLSFIIFAYLPIKRRLMTRLVGTLECIMIFQIFFSICKLFTLGVTEAAAGTISYSGGAINTVFPLLAISWFLSKYIYFKQKKVYLLYCLGFLFMGYVGGKRAIFFFLPVILLFIVFLKNHLEAKRLLSKKNGKIIILVLLVIITTFYLGVKMTPTMNRERSKWGSFDLEFVLDYAIEYNYRPNREYVRGRMAGLVQSFKYTADLPPDKILFGSGPDQLINYESRDGTERRFGISNSGAITGLATYLLSVGVVGSILVFALHLMVGGKVYSVLKRDYKKKKSPIDRYRFFILCATLVFAIDFIFYTRSFVHSSALSLLYFSFGGISLNKRCAHESVGIVRGENRSAVGPAPGYAR